MIRAILLTAIEASSMLAFLAMAFLILAILLGLL